MGVKIAGPIRWQAVFFIGPAASGKSYVKVKKYLNHLDFKSIDPDEIKEKNPDYDPEQPFKLHQWSKAISESQYKKIVTDGQGTPVVVDGTGRNWTSIERKMNLAKDNGYRTYLVYVYVPFEVSIFRNRNRPRFVPEDVILEQANNITDSFRYLKSDADKWKVIPNYQNSEVSEAKKDIRLYPVPQPVRPPRPGDPDYGNTTERVARRLVSLARQLLKG